jgi:hypothetical protein
VLLRGRADAVVKAVAALLRGEHVWRAQQLMANPSLKEEEDKGKEDKGEPCCCFRPGPKELYLGHPVQLVVQTHALGRHVILSHSRARQPDQKTRERKKKEQRNKRTQGTAQILQQKPQKIFTLWRFFFSAYVSSGGEGSGGPSNARKTSFWSMERSRHTCTYGWSHGSDVLKSDSIFRKKGKKKEKKSKKQKKNTPEM